MKKQISKKALIVGAVIGVILTLCAVPILINNINKDATKLAKVEEPETKQYSTAPTVGSESELEKFGYETDDNNKIVKLKHISDSTITSIVIYSKYQIKGTEYSTIIDGDDSLFKQNGFIRGSKLESIIMQDGVTLRGNVRGMFNDNSSSTLKTVIFGNINTSNVTSMSGMFGNFITNIVGLDKWDTSNVTDMSYMFGGSITNIVGLDKWDTSNVTNMSGMFSGCSDLTNIVGLDKWDTSNVTNMSGMFTGCSDLTNIVGLDKWDTSKVTKMSYMFSGCSDLTNIVGLDKWDTSNVINMDEMFRSCSSLTDIVGLNKWNTSKVADMNRMFANCNSIKKLDLSSFDMTKVASWSRVDMFKDCNFDILITPKIGRDATLPYTMYDENGTSYTKLPSTSKTLYKEIPTKKYTVTFVSEGTTVDTQTVEEGQGATAPSLVKEGYTLSWDKEFSNITSDLTVNAVWTINTYTVTFKNGEEVAKTETVNYGAGATAPSLVKEGYTLSWDKEFSNVTSDLTVNAVWTPNTDTVYKVEHYKQGESGYTLADTDNLTGTTDREVTAEAKTYAGYTENTTISQRVPSGIVAGDGSLVLKLYYDRNTDTAYTVKHYKQQGNTTTYTLADIDNLIGTTDSTVTAEAKTYEGYVENTETSQRIPSGIVTGDGSLELVLIYDTIKLTVTFKDGEDIVETKTVVYGENVIPPSIEKPGYTLTWDKSLENIIEDQTINAVWTANEGIAYKVEHYQQNTDLETYTLADTDNLTGTTGEEITATLKEYTGFSIQETDNTV